MDCVGGRYNAEVDDRFYLAFVKPEMLTRATNQIFAVQVKAGQFQSLAIAEQADDQAFVEQARRECEHIWERVDYRVWQCEACGDLADLSEGWE